MIKFENKSNGRFYYLLVQHDLFGDRILLAIRGGCYARVIRTLAFGDEQTIEKAISRISKQRLKRGYTLVV